MRRLLGPQVPIEHSFFLIPRISGILCGIWPRPQRSWLTVLQFWVNTCAVALGAFGENLYGFAHLDNLFSALEAFCPGGTKAICLLKMLLFFTYHKSLRRIVDKMRTLLLQDTKGKSEKRDIMQRMASLASILSFILLMAGTMTNVFFNLLPLLRNGWRWWHNDEIRLELPFNLLLPEMFSEMPLYPLTYLALTLSGTMTVFTFSAVDGFFVCTCMYTCALFRTLQYDIRCIFGVLEQFERATVAQNMAFRQQLSALVERHNAIIDLCSEFTGEFALIIMMHFLSAALVLCFAILDLMLNSASIGVLTYIFYSIAALTQLFLYCIGGSFVSQSSLEVAETLYDVEWYKCDSLTRRMILMMLRRAQKAKSVSVPFFTPSLPAFSSMISTAGSYIALLKTFL